MLRWGSGTKRWVVRAPDAGKGGSWIHQAARLGFETLDERVYLSIAPTVMFTTEGTTPVPREVAGPLTMKWSGKERNGAILLCILMWSDALTNGRREAAIEAGDQKLVIARLPMASPCPIGLADDKVTVGALLEFTRVEMNPDDARADLFKFIDDEVGAHSE